MNTTKSIQLTLEGLPPNPNQTKRNHWAANYTTSQEWKTISFYTAKQAYKGIPFPLAHVHFKISVGDNRRHDADNIIASLKPVLDGLVGVVIIDDNIDSIGLSYSFDRAKPRGMEITITPID